MLKIRHVLSVLSVAALVAACGLDETYTGLGKGALPGDPLNPVPQPVLIDEDLFSCNCRGGGGPAADVPLATVADLEGRAWRIETLKLKGPLEGFYQEQINEYFATELAAGTMNIVVAVKLDDRENGTLDLLAGSALVDGGGYKYDGDSAELVCDLTGDYFSTLETSALDIPNEMLDPPTLPIKQLRLSGVFDISGTAISGGKLTGALTKEDADGITLLGPLSDLLIGLEYPMDLDLDEDDQMDAWLFEFSFGAAEVELKEAK